MCNIYLCYWYIVILLKLLNVKRGDGVCCVVRSCLDIEVVFLNIVVCLLALHYITFSFFVLRTVYYTCYARSRPNYNRHASSVTKFLLESTTGLWMLVGCLLSSSPILVSLVPSALSGGV